MLPTIPPAGRAATPGIENATTPGPKEGDDDDNS